MSKGLGHIQRKIDQLFATDPEGVFSTEDLCLAIYGQGFRQKPGWPTMLMRTPKKQRVAVIRAAKAVAKKHLGIAYWRSERRGGSCLWFHHDNVMSYAIASERSWNPKTNQQARKSLENERHRALMAPGGHWWRHVQEWIAERDGDTAKMEEFRALREAAEQETLAKLESVLRTNKH